MMGKSFSLIVFILIAFLEESNSSRVRMRQNGDSTNPKSFARTSLLKDTISKSEFALPFKSLIDFKNFALDSLLASNSSIKDSGKTFLKSMFSTFVTSTGTIRAMEHLQTLKATLLNQFHKKARELVNGRSSEFRDHGHHHGGIGFPSLEGALLSLAFLTFAVFLIDLIQQLVSRYRTGYAVPLLGRRRRSVTENPRSDELDNFHPLTTLTTTVLSVIENPLFLNTLYDL